MKNGRVVWSGWACIVGALVVLATGPVLDSQSEGESTKDTPLARAANGAFAVGVLGLAAGVAGFRASGVPGAGRLALGAFWATLAGLALWTIGGLYLTLDASRDQLLTPVGGLVSAVGMILLGVASARAGRVNDWRRFAPLLVGAWFFLQLPLQALFFIGPRGSPSYTLLLGGFGALWALFGGVVVSMKPRAPAAASPRASRAP